MIEDDGDCLICLVQITLAPFAKEFPALRASKQILIRTLYPMEINSIFFLAFSLSREASVIGFLVSVFLSGGGIF